MKRSCVRSLAMLLAAVQGLSLTAYAPTNFFRPYDQAVRLPVVRKASLMVGMLGEFGATNTGRNVNGRRRNVLALQNDDQATIVMLDNASSANRAAFDTVLRTLNADDDGVRGHVKLDGSFREYDVNFSAAYQLGLDKIPGTVSLGVQLPVINRKVSNIRMTNLTNTTNVPQPADFRAKAFADDIVAQAKTLGNLDLGAWSKIGVGDTSITLDWFNRFRQDRDFLKAVELFARVGLLVPTADEKDEDRAFSMALGSDGAFGIPVGVGLNLEFVHHIAAGVNIDFLGLFDHAKIRRLKTNSAQTEFLLMNKGDATREHGLLWQFHLYLQSYHFLGGLSAKAAYQFVKHDADRLSPRNNDFTYDVVNTAQTLREWTAHNFIFMINYDHASVRTEHTGPVPQFSIFAKLPVDGRALIDATTFGGQFNVAF